MAKKISLKDVARHVGVSTALVSYVINNKEKEARVGAEMVQRIRQAVAELNYQPNLIAKSLKSGKTHTIGLIVADISNPFFSTIARIIEDEAKKEGYIVLIGSSDENPEKSQDLINVFFNRQVDAFIIAPVENTETQIKELQKKNVPVVLIDRYFITVETDSVHIDNFQAAYDAVEHLAINGNKKIAMIGYNTSLTHMQERKNGYKAALKANGIKLRSELIKNISYQNIEKEVTTAMRELLDFVPKIDGIFFATNTLAIEGLKIIYDSEIRVPEELSIISFDESDAFDFFYSPLSYVRQPLAEMGKKAVTLAIEKIKDNDKKYTIIIVKGKLVLRKSCSKKK
ncbi:MAG: substrate-binding domain-containing protein [Ginsengibacter sp.]